MQIGVTVYKESPKHDTFKFKVVDENGGTIHESGSILQSRVFELRAGQSLVLKMLPERE